MPDSALTVGFNTPFQEQIDFLRAKLRLPTERWDDIMRSAHDRAFIVAGAAKADLLADLHASLAQAATDGRGLDAWRKDFRGIVEKHGWRGWTGDGTKGGEAWRTRVIYQTNMATSYAAGRYRQLTDPGFLALRPFWRYIHSDSVMHPRPWHLAWHGLTLRHDHEFWKTHFPPNGWGCQCRVTAVSKREGEASARAGLADPPEGWRAVDGKSGEPVGIDKGFGYTPGASVDLPLRQFVQDKLITYPPAITRALTVDVNRYINATEQPADFVRAVIADKGRRDPLWLGFVEKPSELNALVESDVTGFTVLLPADAPRHVQDHHAWDGGTQRPATASDYQLIMDVLNTADSLKKGNAENGHKRVVASKVIGGETFRAVFEVRPGKKNRALALVTLAIKTAK